MGDAAMSKLLEAPGELLEAKRRIEALEAENALLKRCFGAAADRIGELGTAVDARPFWTKAQEFGCYDK